MKILWSVNTIIPDVANAIGLRQSHAISWVDAMRTALLEHKPEVELCIVCSGDGQVNDLLKESVNGITYYIMPSNRKRAQYWDGIINEYCPEVIHAYGTEKCHNIPLIDKYADKIPIIISLQGLLSEYKRHYYAFIPLKTILLNYTVRDFIRGGIIKGKRNFEKQGKKEQYMLNKVRFVEGRSDWDKAVSMRINPKLKYYCCPRMIRSPFFDYKWDSEQYEKHSLFVHQGNYPIKGLHFMLEAISLISKKYPDIKLYISGGDILNQDKLREGGYTRYIRKMIQDLSLEDKIVFTGYLNADELAKKLSNVNICIIPSAIENAPNALAEAMIVGTPCIASHVGGNAEMLDFGNCGMLYSYYEPQLLADRIDRYFSYPTQAAAFADKGRAFARQNHDPALLTDTLLNIYRDAIESFKMGK